MNKIIHYCWFGRGEKPKDVIKSIESWKKFCPDYEIIEWNEDNFDISSHPYTKKAYELKKWAFVSDYARLYIVYNEGGVYLDTDVEIVKNLDPLLENEAYMGFEDEKYVNTGSGFGAEKGHSFLLENMKAYDGECVVDENGNKKKLSKRDMGANMDDYSRMGYAPACVCEYIMTLLNSNYEEWRMQNPDKSYRDFPFNIKKMSTSGCLFDFDKLNDVSKNVISRMSAEKVATDVAAWANEFDKDFGAALSKDIDYATKIFAIGRGGKKPRKDLATWCDAKPYMGFFYDEFFNIQDPYPETFDRADIAATLRAFLEGYDETDDMNAWFDKIKKIAASLGYADDMKSYKENPAAFKGNVADVSMFIRVAVTGKFNAPDLYTVMQILGKDRTAARVSAMIEKL